MKSKIVVMVLSIIAAVTLLALAVTNISGCGKKKEECPPCPTLDEVREILAGTRPALPKGCGPESPKCPSIDEMLSEEMSRSFRIIEDYRLGGAR